MFMILHMFNESSSKGAAAAAKFQLPRGAVWTAFSGEVAEIAFQSKGYRCETWPAGGQSSTVILSVVSSEAETRPRMLSTYERAETQSE